MDIKLESLKIKQPITKNLFNNYADETFFILEHTMPMLIIAINDRTSRVH
jgi:hypothetical protein